MADKIDNLMSATVYDGFEEMIANVRRDAYAAGFRAGAEAMRDAAAKECRRLAFTNLLLYGESWEPNIRALPLPEPPK